MKYEEFLIEYPMSIEVQNIPFHPIFKNTNNTYDFRMKCFHIVLTAREKNVHNNDLSRSMMFYYMQGIMRALDWAIKKHKFVGELYWMIPAIKSGKLGKCGYEDFHRITRNYKPDLVEILDCLVSDAAGVDQDFKDWANDMGFDTDSISAKKTYERACEQTDDLKRILGHDVFDLLMTCDRL